MGGCYLRGQVGAEFQRPRASASVAKGPQPSLPNAAIRGACGLSRKATRDRSYAALLRKAFRRRFLNSPASTAATPLPLNPRHCRRKGFSIGLSFGGCPAMVVSPRASTTQAPALLVSPSPPCSGPHAKMQISLGNCRLFPQVHGTAAQPFPRDPFFTGQARPPR